MNSLFFSTFFVFFHHEKNLWNLDRKCDPIARIITGGNEKQAVDIMLEKKTSLLRYDSVTSHFLTLLKRHRKEVFLCLQNPMVEKTSDIVVQHLSIRSWLFKHRFRTKEVLIRTYFWYHQYLSTGS
jgi:hypothetical protein